MQFSKILVSLAAISVTGVVADFDMWETSTSFISSGTGEWSPWYSDLFITQSYINFDQALKQGRGAMGWTRIEELYCNRGIKFNNGCAIIKNCGQLDPTRVKDGQKFGDLEDCGGGNRGTCYAWHGGYSTVRLNPRENRISYSRVACKTAFFKGEEAIGPW